MTDDPRWLFLCIDAPGKARARLEARPEHIEYMMAVKDITVFGGPLRNDEDTESDGSIFCLRLPDRDAAMEFMRDEPYNRAGVFESVIIRRFRQMVPELTENALQRELESERRRMAGQREGDP